MTFLTEYINKNINNIIVNKIIIHYPKAHIRNKKTEKLVNLGIRECNAEIIKKLTTMSYLFWIKDIYKNFKNFYKIRYFQFELKKKIFFHITRSWFKNFVD